MAILSFDIEIADVFELAPGEDLDAYAPFHISVAATQIAGGEERLWLSRDADGRPASHLDREGARALTDRCVEMARLMVDGKIAERKLVRGGRKAHRSLPVVTGGDEG